jgi:hypothetical protein
MDPGKEHRPCHLPEEVFSTGYTFPAATQLFFLPVYLPVLIDKITKFSG